PADGSQRANGNAHGPYDSSAKRTAVVPAGATAGRTPAAKAPAKATAVAAQRAAALAADQRTGRQVAVDGARALRPAQTPDGPRSAKQHAVAAAAAGPLLPPAAAGASAARLPVVAPTAIVPLPTKVGRQTELQPVV